MGKATVHGKNGGQLHLLKKLWEGSLTTTEAVADITSGAIDPDNYDVLLVHYEGECTVTRSGSVAFGIGKALKTGNVTGDITFSQSKSHGAATVLMLHGDNEWNILRKQDGVILVSTSEPLSLKEDHRDSGFSSATFHFAVYGMKL